MVNLHRRAYLPWFWGSPLHNLREGVKYKRKGSVMAHGCFISAIYWKIYAFSPIFRWRAPWPEDFIGYPFWISRDKASTVFYDTANFIKKYIVTVCFKNFKGSVIVCSCFISTARWTYGLFSSFPLGGVHGWGILLVIPLLLQGKRHQPFSMTQPFQKAVFKFVVDTRFQLKKKSSLEIIWRSRNNSSRLDFM